MKESQELEKYILSHIEPEEQILQELNRDTHLKTPGGRMVSGHLQGQFLTMLVRMIRPEIILELGTFTGYSAICLAKGLTTGGKLITIEIDDELKDISHKYFKKAKLEDKIIQLSGPALEIIPALNETFDLVFLDADKREYPDYYKAVFNKIKKGGYILADNTLWGGKIFRSPPPRDAQSRGIIEFNELIKNDLRIEKIILSVRDGMTLIRKK